jgi:hypothetical protein
MDGESVSFSQPFEGGEPEIAFPSCFECLVILVGHPGRFGEGFLCEPLTAPQFAQSSQEQRDRSVRQSQDISRLPLAHDTPQTVVLQSVMRRWRVR